MLCFEKGSRWFALRNEQVGSSYRVQVVSQRGDVLFWVAAKVGGVGGLLPLPAGHRHAPPPPVIQHRLQVRGAAHDVVFTVEEEGRRRHGAVVENLDGPLVEVNRVGFKEPEVEQRQVPDQALQSRHQGLPQT